MDTPSDVLLPGLPVEAILERYRRAQGNELGNAKFSNSESSAALAANAFGFFLVGRSRRSIGPVAQVARPAPFGLQRRVGEQLLSAARAYR